MHSFYLVLVLGFVAFCAAQSIKIPRACSTPTTNRYPFCNPKLSRDERLKNLISLIQTDEKPPLLTARESPRGNISRIGLPEYDWGLNCVHGVQSRCGTNCPTSFPNPNALGASWNMTNVLVMGQIIGIEMRALWLEGVGENHANNLPHMGLDCWSPNININRDPRWGRNLEVASEDPFINGQYGIAYTRGLQEGEDKRFLQGVVTLKHWDAYSLESYNGATRHNFNAKVSQYDLANTYFPAFKDTVQQANAKGVMCSYNALNGVPTCASKFLNSTLRGDWGFTGYVTSDSGAIFDIYGAHHYAKTYEEAAADGILGGTDINSGSVYLSHLNNAVTQGLIKESDVDLALYRTLGLRIDLGLFDPIDDQPYWHVPPTVVGTAAHQEINLFTTLQSMVLLKNDDNTLPFPKGKNIAVVGPHANATGALLGNYLGQICKDDTYNCILSPHAQIKAANVGGQTSLSEGCTVSGTSTSGFAAAKQAVEQADYVIMMLGIDTTVEREGEDRHEISLPGVQNEFAEMILGIGKPTAVVLFNGGAVAIDALKDKAPAIVEAYYPGYQGGKALAMTLLGDYNPGGKLAYTIYDSKFVNESNFLDMSMTNPPGRSYRYYTGTPLWTFGHGLSYTTFKMEWHNTTTGEPHIVENDKAFELEYEVKVTNTGKREGDEVVQAYYYPKGTSTADPLIKQLFGFQRVHLGAGDSTTVKFTMKDTTLRVGDEKGNIVSSPGEYQIEFTNGVDQTIHSVVTVKGDVRVLEAFPEGFEE
mmetsp:Transcript_8016/g.8854  ORF Transcript_8016/g.8854 Transcript_8016/m.8854 type:complete len:761 (+) Transcript_8016:22-2304(+)